MEIKKIGIIGAGIMGHGIAQVVSSAGLNVVLNDVKEEYLEKAKLKINESLNKMLKKGKINKEDMTRIFENIIFTTDMKKVVEDADLIIEAVSEDLELKKYIFKELENLSKKNTILATNTSQYSITEIASATNKKNYVVGMHWFNPPVVMKLIEIVKGLETSDEVIEIIKEFARKLGKETVVCRDSQGFISTRVLMALRLECYRLFEEGIATKEEIDKTLKLALGHPMGQFELADYSGLDIEVPVCEALTKIFGERFLPTQSLLHLVRSGRYGRKSGKGWYEYEQTGSEN